MVPLMLVAVVELGGQVVVERPQRQLVVLVVVVPALVHQELTLQRQGTVQLTQVVAVVVADGTEVARVLTAVLVVPV
jgi:hypothetical protein